MSLGCDSGAVGAKIKFEPFRAPIVGKLRIGVRGGASEQAAKAAGVFARKRGQFDIGVS